ncbi:MAG: site-specific integrase [Blautia massiliensis (ex Durand et al. 2017)]
MNYQKIVTQYENWLIHREYSPATIQKYTRALTRFFSDTGAGRKPTRETVAAWRDSLTAKGYTPSTVNSMLAAVNDYQESIGNLAGKAKPLKR